MAVVVDHENAVAREQRIEVGELVPGRFVPVGVEAQQGDPRRQRRRDRRLDLAFDEVDPLLRIAGRPEVGLDVGKAGLAPDAGAARRPRQARRGALAVRVAVGGGGLAHALEGVVEPEIARRVAARQQRQRREHHAAAAPDAALDDVAGDAVAHEVVDRAEQAGAPVEAGHRERLDAGDELAVGGSEVGERALAPVGGARQLEAAARQGALDQLLHGHRHGPVRRATSRRRHAFRAGRLWHRALHGEA